MFEDFKKAVLEYYVEKKNRHQLSENLEIPTQAKLKKECLLILEKRYKQKDDEAIKAFFDPDDKFRNHELSIEKFELDGFKALLQFFLGKARIRKEENIKLLAWLIDFEPRPYVFGETYGEAEKLKTTSETEKSNDDNITDEIDTTTTTEIEIIDIQPPPTPTPWKKISTIAFISILLISLSTYIFSLTSIGDQTLARKETHLPSADKPIYTSLVNNPEEVQQTKSLPVKDVQCMFWADDHYEPIPCDKEIGDTTKIALDTQKVAHFKKINEPDTLTRNSLGKTWYISINGSREYYTSEGFHPIHTDRKLRRLSDYILSKYILSKR